MLPEYELDRNTSLFLKWRHKLSWNLVFKQHLRRWEASDIKWRVILGDPGAVSRVDKMSVVKGLL